MMNRRKRRPTDFCLDRRPYCRLGLLLAIFGLLLPMACGREDHTTDIGTVSEATPGSTGTSLVVLSPDKQVPEAAERVTLRRELHRPAADRLEVTVRVQYEGSQPVTALGIVEEPPSGWFLEQVGGDHSPQIAPGRGHSGRLEFVWISTPSFPFTFSYALAKQPDIPETPEPLRGKAVYRRLGGEEQSEEAISPLPAGSPSN